MPVIITNCSNNYGPKQHPEKLIPKLFIISLIILTYLFMVMVKILENGFMLKIIVLHYLEVFKKGKIGEFYNIGSNENINNINICSKLFKIFEKVKF
jgi:dTDP-glucose 4,6-dehydratase